MKKVLFSFAALIALTSGRACSRSAKLKQVWLCSCLLAALAACGNKQTAAPETESSKVTNEVVTNDTISKEMKEANMQEVQAYLKECGAFLPQPTVTNPMFVPSAYQRLSMAVYIS